MTIGIGAVLGLVLVAQPAAAFFNRDLNAPWCHVHSDESGRVDCGYYSYSQCMETRLGAGGSCEPNPVPRGAERRPVRSSPWLLPR
jgi:hypothetical protein